MIYIEDFYRNSLSLRRSANGGSIKGMLDAIDLIEKVAGVDTTLPGHGTLITKKDLLAYRPAGGLMARVTTLRNRARREGRAGGEPDRAYDKTTQGDTQQSQNRFITEAYDEVKDFPLLSTANGRCRRILGNVAVTPIYFRDGVRSDRLKYAIQAPLRRAPAAGPSVVYLSDQEKVMPKRWTVNSIVAAAFVMGYFVANQQSTVQGQAAPGAGFAAVPSSVGALDLTGPYDVARDWPKDISTLQGNESEPLAPGKACLPRAPPGLCPAARPAAGSAELQARH